VAWKNHLAYFATVAGGLSVLAAAVAFLAISSKEVRRFVAWRDEATVLLLESWYGAQAHDLTVANTGDGEIVLLGLIYYAQSSKHSPSRTLRLGETIAPGKSGRSQGNLASRATTEDFGIVGKNMFGTCEAAMDRFVKDKSTGLAPCMEAGTYTPQHPAVQHFRQFYKASNNPLCEFSSEASLFVFSISSRRTFESKFSVVTLLSVDLERPECKP
jgi:hypothetical protein